MALNCNRFNKALKPYTPLVIKARGFFTIGSAKIHYSGIGLLFEHNFLAFYQAINCRFLGKN